ncbi:MAG: hypothetical protein KQJ78_03255 [Deltaproteobacteria bacterium]|nr:hypothetical protein [Deltaproteobacteria bacterium]
MDSLPKPPIAQHTRTMCAVCAWRETCKKKFSYEQGGTVKCPDYTRDASLPPEPEE